VATLQDDLHDQLIRLKKGDRQSFKTVYELYVNSLYSFVLRFVKSHSIAEDVVQETFIRIWEMRESVDPSRAFQGFLYKIAKNLVLNLLARSRHENHILTEILSATNDFSNRTEEEVYFNETSQVIQDGISKLPPQQRKIIELCKYQGFTYEQAAEKLQLSSNTINGHMVGALRSLKKYLGSHEPSKRPDTLPRKLI
jgi:RNA polymerase sigma-70 factor (family 1)